MNDSEDGIGWWIAWERMAGVISRCMHVWLVTSSPLMSAPPRQRLEKNGEEHRRKTGYRQGGGGTAREGGGVTTEREAPYGGEGAQPAVERRRQSGGVSLAGGRATSLWPSRLLVIPVCLKTGRCIASEGGEWPRGGGTTTREEGGAARGRCRQSRSPVDQGALRGSRSTAYKSCVGHRPA